MPTIYSELAHYVMQGLAYPGLAFNFRTISDLSSLIWEVKGLDCCL